MSWEYRPAFDAAHRAALQADKHLVFVCPPAGWAALPLLGHIPVGDDPSTETLILVADVTDAVELEAMLAATRHVGPALAVTGLARAQRLLQVPAAVRTLLATPPDAMELIRRTALKPDRLRRVVVCWPDRHAALGHTHALDMLLAEAKGAGRLVASADPKADEAFIERHARRAPVAIASQVPDQPGPGLRYAVVDGARAANAVIALLDVLNPATACVWDPTPDGAQPRYALTGDPTVTAGAALPHPPVDLAIAACLPTAEALAALRAAARNVVVLVRATQVPYLERLAQPLKPVPWSQEADRARDAAHRLRSGLRQRLAAGDVAGNLLVLAPLFDEFDPALVAAAALSAPGGSEPDHAPADVPTWIVLRLSSGQRDRLRAADVVGTLINVVGLPKDHVGLVDIRESFTLVYVRAESAERARQELDGATIRGRQVAVTLDRR